MKNYFKIQQLNFSLIAMTLLFSPLSRAERFSIQITDFVQCKAMATKATQTSEKKIITYNAGVFANISGNNKGTYLVSKLGSSMECLWLDPGTRIQYIEAYTCICRGTIEIAIDPEVPANPSVVEK